MRRTVGIYKITSPTGKIYVGQSGFIERRFQKYKRLECESQPRLYNSLKKYNIESHIFEIIERCDKVLLNKRERYYQDLYSATGVTGLNCDLTTDGNCKKKTSVETRLKISKALLGRSKSKRALKNIQEASRRNCKQVICTVTDIVYNNHHEAAELLGILPKTLYSKLAGYRKNNTTLIYYEII